MKNLRACLALATALILCLSLTACGGTPEPDVPDDEVIVGDDWRTTGVVQGSGTITRGGEDTFVLVCIHAEDAAFYYDEKEQVLFDFVEYPTALAGDPWAMFQSIDFADRTGDGNSDAALLLDDNGSTILMVWFWDKDSQSFVFQPEESQLPEGGEAGA